MTKRVLSAGLSGLVLAVTAVACAPSRVLGQDAAGSPVAAPPEPPAAPQQLVAEPAPLSTTQPARRLLPSALLEDQVRALDAQARAVEAHARTVEAAQAKTAAHVLTRSLHAKPPSDAPALLVTQPMDPTAQAELKEDLGVMDKLIRDEIARQGAEEGGGRAMGIKLMVLNRGAVPPPMYLEGAGVVFSAAVNWPLTPSPNGSARRDGKPRERLTPWESAKLELKGPKDVKFQDVEVPQFEQERVDALTAAIVKLLPEATNFRHLKENESVFVTIVGFDDAGAPRRMTFKATKADIDAAAGGKIDPDAFKQRVAFQIGQ